MILLDHWLKSELNQPDLELLERVVTGDADKASTLAASAPNHLRGYLAVYFFLLDTPLDAYRAYLECAWLHDHRYVIDAAQNRKRLKAMFRKAAFAPPPELPEMVAVWRGTSHLQKKDAIKGVSWTTDRDVACFFACRFGGVDCHPLVLRAEVSRTSIFLYSNTRGESEALCFDVKHARIDGDVVEWTAGYERECARIHANRLNLLHKIAT